VKHFLGLVFGGIIAALAFTVGAIAPLFVTMPVALIFCACLIGSAIAAERRDARRLAGRG
jgi:hypothetical protein